LSGRSIGGTAYQLRFLCLSGFFREVFLLDEITGSTSPKPTLAFLGTGRVGSALARRLLTQGYSIVSLYNRSMNSCYRLAEQVGAQAATRAEEATHDADLVFITTPDDAIATVCQAVADAGGWYAGQAVVHCSGALPAQEVLAPAAATGAHVGGLHPLQSFADVETAIECLPGSYFGVEADDALRPILNAIVAAVGGHILPISPVDKTLYHASAVMACNYVVGIFGVAVHLLQNLGIPATDAEVALLPLLESTVRNLRAVGLPDALTGPLARGDVGTVDRHVRALDKHEPALGDLYRLLGRATLPLAVAKWELEPGAGPNVERERDGKRRHQVEKTENRDPQYKEEADAHDDS